VQVADTADASSGSWLQPGHVVSSAACLRCIALLLHPAAYAALDCCCNLLFALFAVA
jgi:hypothetical protein